MKAIIITTTMHLVGRDNVQSNKVRLQEQIHQLHFSVKMLHSSNANFCIQHSSCCVCTRHMPTAPNGTFFLAAVQYDHQLRIEN